MGLNRLLLAGLLLAALAAAAVGLALRPDAAPGAAGTHAVEVLGPDGTLFAGEVHVPAATALSVLLAAGATAGFDVVVEEYPGMGAYVRAVGPHRAAGAAGWLYEVGDADGWRLGDRSAAQTPLAPGEAVRWRWTSDGR